jgi:hypothetical protein
VRDDDNCVVLFYKGRRYWVGRANSTADLPHLRHALERLMVEADQGVLAAPSMDGPEK